VDAFFFDELAISKEGSTSYIRLSILDKYRDKSNQIILSRKIIFHSESKKNPQPPEGGFIRRSVFSLRRAYKRKVLYLWGKGL